MNNIHVKTGDTVVISPARTRASRARFCEVSPKESKVIVEGLNMVTKHVKPRKMGDPGGIMKAEAAMYRLQGHGCLPQVRQADPPGPQARATAPRPASARRAAKLSK